jgi:hypothetical protein
MNSEALQRNPQTAKPFQPSVPSRQSPCNPQKLRIYLSHRELAYSETLLQPLRNALPNTGHFQKNSDVESAIQIQFFVFGHRADYS